MAFSFLIIFEVIKGTNYSKDIKPRPYEHRLQIF